MSKKVEGLPVKSRAKLYTYRGEQYTIKQISQQFNINLHTLEHRIYTLLYPIEKAIEEPVVRGKSKYSPWGGRSNGVFRNYQTT